MSLSTACLVATIAATQLGAPTAGAAGLEIPRIDYTSAMIVEVAGEAPAVAKMTAGETATSECVMAGETATSECVMGEAHAAECEDRDDCNFDKGLHDDCFSLTCGRGAVQADFVKWSVCCTCATEGRLACALETIRAHPRLKSQTLA